MSLNPTGYVSYNWNYNKPDKAGYSLELYGTVVSIQEVQGRKFNPQDPRNSQPDFWPNGNPKMNIRVGVAQPDGTFRCFTFAKPGRAQQLGQKPSLYMDLFHLAGDDMNALMGKTIHVQTWPNNPSTGQAWGLGNPRLFAVEEIEEHYELVAPIPAEFKIPEVYANNAASGGQVVQQPQQQMAPRQIQQPMVPQGAGQFYAGSYNQPQMYQQPQPQPQPQYGYQQLAPQYQQYQQPQQQYGYAAPQPQGMDPNVAAAMQSLGAVNVQPVAGPYDEDMPF